MEKARSSYETRTGITSPYTKNKIKYYQQFFGVSNEITKLADIIPMREYKKEFSLVIVLFVSGNTRGRNLWLLQNHSEWHSH